MDGLESKFGTRLHAAAQGWPYPYTHTDILLGLTLNAITGERAFDLSFLTADERPEVTPEDWQAGLDLLSQHTKEVTDG